MPEERIQKKLQELMTHFDLYRYADFSVEELSGGWRQRVLIARALMHDPKIVLLDEPTVGLDPDVRRSLWAYIKKLKDMGITVVLTTHYLDEAEALADRVCIMNRGKVLLTENLHTLREQHSEYENLEAVFLHLIEQEEE